MSARSIRRARRRQAEIGRRRRRPAAVAGAAALGATVVFAPAADAETFTVTSLADDLSEGTLRNEIDDANAAVGDDVIVFQSGLSGTIALADDDIWITAAGLQIQGPGAGVITVDAGADRIFDASDFIASNEVVSISGLTLANGSVQNPGGAFYGHAGAGEAPAVTVADSVLTGNYSQSGGGAIAVDGGSLTVSRSTIAGNQTAGEGGGITVIDGDGDVLIEDTTISANTAGSGGGGGVTVRGPNISSVTVDRSTLVANEATGHGGGLQALETGGPVTVQNSTLSGNTAGDNGGGAYFYSDTDNVRTVLSSTVTGNAAGQDGGGIYQFPYFGGGFGAADTLQLSSTIVAGNTAPSDGPDLFQNPNPGGDPPPVPPAFNVGFSLIGDPADADIAEAPAGSNLFGVDPQLGPLASNGGPTQTQLPALTSPVVDHGIANGLPIDQRGLGRPGDLSLFANATGGDGTDIGAVEIQAADCQGQGGLKIDGTEGDDSLLGTEGPDAISALGGADSASAAAGNDCVSGGAGNDRLRGAAGNDQLKGEAGRDNLKGGGGKDRLAGAAGKDKLSGGGGKDRLKGGPGKDTLKGGGGKDRFNCGGGEDKVTAQPKDKVSGSCENVVQKR